MKVAGEVKELMIGISTEVSLMWYEMSNALYRRKQDRNEKTDCPQRNFALMTTILNRFVLRDFFYI